MPRRHGAAPSHGYHRANRAVRRVTRHFADELDVLNTRRAHFEAYMQERCDNFERHMQERYKKLQKLLVTHYEFLRENIVETLNELDGPDGLYARLAALEVEVAQMMMVMDPHGLVQVWWVHTIVISAILISP